MDHNYAAMKRDFIPVFFDLERTGHYDWDEILRIGAIHKDNIFCRYILPTTEIPPYVSELTRFTKNGEQLLHRGEVKETTTLKEALENLLEYLEQFNKPVIMIGHNCFTFDCRFILRGLRQYGLLSQFTRIVQGFTDSLPLLKKYLPGKPSYYLKLLAVDILGPNLDFVTHVTDNDAIILVSIFRKEKIKRIQIFEFARSVKDVLKKEDGRIIAKKNLLVRKALQLLITTGSKLTKMVEEGQNIESLKEFLEAEAPEGPLLDTVSTSPKF
nr:PREDICTED: uncharacterized protein LOC109037131 [Bemisia tabaci]XP_018907185.1 PREDICTED: uncharacterized protein LOC109037131 [Bemisia tabaci]